MVHILAERSYKDTNEGGYTTLISIEGGGYTTLISIEGGYTTLTSIKGGYTTIISIFFELIFYSLQFWEFRNHKFCLD